MRSFCMLLLSIGALWGPIYAQATAATGPVKSIKVQEFKPTVYMSVERKDKKTAWLRLNNNTTWAISVLTGSFYFNRKATINLANGKSVFALPADQEINSLHYYVENESMTSSHVKVPELHYPDSSSISWIPSKGSILFSVPITQLQAGLMLYVPFHYEWELSEQLIFNNEPEHRIYIRGVDIP